MSFGEKLFAAISVLFLFIGILYMFWPEVFPQISTAIKKPWMVASKNPHKKKDFLAKKKQKATPAFEKDVHRLNQLNQKKKVLLENLHHYFQQKSQWQLQRFRALVKSNHQNSFWFPP